MFNIQHTLVDQKARKIYSVDGRCLETRKLANDTLANAVYVASNNDSMLTFLFMREQHSTALYRASAQSGVITLSKFPNGEGALLYPFDSCTVASGGGFIVLLGSVQGQMEFYVYKISDSSARSQKAERLAPGAQVFCQNERFYVYVAGKVYFLDPELLQPGDEVLISPVRPSGPVQIYQRGAHALFCGRDGVWVFAEGIFVKLEPGMLDCAILGKFLVNSRTEMLSELQRVPTYRELEFLNYKQSKTLLEMAAQ